MRLVKPMNVIVTMLLVLTCFACDLVAQEDNKQERDQTQETQNLEKKSAEGQGERATSAVESVSNSLISYRLEFTLSELSDTGKKINSRTYSVVSQIGPRNKLRVGGRVPIATGTGSGTPENRQKPSHNGGNGHHLWPHPLHGSIHDGGIQVMKCRRDAGGLACLPGVVEIHEHDDPRLSGHAGKRDEPDRHGD